MTAAKIDTITEVSVEDMPYSRKAGTGRRRVKFVIRGTSGATTDFLNLADYVPGLSGIEGVGFHSVAGVVRTTYPTWDGTTLTFAGHTSTGVTIVEVIGFLK